MSGHKVTVEVPKRQIARADVKFQVKSNGRMLGTLTVSKGSVVWFPYGTSYGCKMGWKKFNATMKDVASRFEKRR